MKDLEERDDNDEGEDASSPPRAEADAEFHACPGKSVAAGRRARRRAAGPAGGAARRSNNLGAVHRQRPKGCEESLTDFP